MRLLSLVPYIVCMILSPDRGLGQASQFIRWEFRSAPLVRDQATLTLVAHLQPGWHIYSQQIGEGGPLPTRISFHHPDHYQLEGKTGEHGLATKYYDDNFEMEITSYSGDVTFVQNIITQEPQTVTGIIDYMMCSDHICIPQQQPFTIDVNPIRKSP